MTRTRFPTWIVGAAALALAALACDPPPVTGITCLQARDNGTILAREEYDSHVSADGGLTWRDNGPIEVDPLEGCAGTITTLPPWTLADPADSRVVYRFNPQISIERSEDGGATWHMEVDLSGTEARNAYYYSIRRDGFDFRSGPLDALIDPGTGNLIVAMGYEGVLVRTPEGRWTWVTVGKYSRADMRDLTITLPLISEELVLALLFGVMTVSSLPVLIQPKNFWLVWAAAMAALIYLIVVLGLAMAIGMSMTGIRDWQAYNTVQTIVTSTTGLFTPVAVIFGVPLVCWLIASRTHQEHRFAFVWASTGWMYLALNTFRITLTKTSELATTVPTIVFALFVLVISGFVLFRSQFSRRTLILAALFGLSGALIVAACYFLWAIGGIPFHAQATLWAAGLTIANLAIGVVIIRRLRIAEPSPAQRDVAPPDAPNLR